MAKAAPFPYVTTNCEEVISTGLVGSEVGVDGWEVGVGVDVIAGVGDMNGLPGTLVGGIGVGVLVSMSV